MENRNGVIRDVDKLGRIVLPIEMRRAAEIEVGESVVITMVNNKIEIVKFQSGCHCCNETEGLTDVLGLKLCPSCIEAFSKARELVDRLR